MKYLKSCMYTHFFAHSCKCSWVVGKRGTFCEICQMIILWYNIDIQYFLKSIFWHLCIHFNSNNTTAYYPQYTCMFKKRLPYLCNIKVLWWDQKSSPHSPCCQWTVVIQYLEVNRVLSDDTGGPRTGLWKVQELFN